MKSLFSAVAPKGDLADQAELSAELAKSAKPSEAKNCKYFNRDQDIGNYEVCVIPKLLKFDQDFSKIIGHVVLFTYTW